MVTIQVTYIPADLQELVRKDAMERHGLRDPLVYHEEVEIPGTGYITVYRATEERY